MGAVRVMNRRLLRNESFERLVDPQRRVPAGSTAVHGITSAMLVGQPTIDVVLPAFARYAADTVLVGHNVGFDMQFLRLSEPRTGVRSLSRSWTRYCSTPLCIPTTRSARSRRSRDASVSACWAGTPRSATPW